MTTCRPEWKFVNFVWAEHQPFAHHANPNSKQIFPRKIQPITANKNSMKISFSSIFLQASRKRVERMEQKDYSLASKKGKSRLEEIDSID